jgi:4-amino-4-deoxy-L-arabinose transferase-like glycosyltransferase
VRRALLLVSLLVAVLFLYTWRLGVRSFWEPDEPRYAEIGREMLVSHDWVIPRLNFLKYYEKPPLTYWVTALSFTCFGVSEGAARTGPVLAALLFLGATWLTGRVLFGARAGAIGALIAALSPLVWITGRLLVTDMFLSAGIAWAICGYALALRAKDRGSGTTVAMGLCGLGLAVALLSKGPIGFVIPLFGIVPLRLAAGRSAALGARAWAAAGGIFLAVGAPWFLTIASRDPAFAWFFVVHEHVLRYLTPEANRQEGFYYYFLILLAGLFPASVLIPWAIRRTWSGLRPKTLEGRGALLLACQGLGTLAFFSASQSKLASYILPAVPAFALLVARALDTTLWVEEGRNTEGGEIERTERGRARREGSVASVRFPGGLRASLILAVLSGTAGAIALGWVAPTQLASFAGSSIDGWLYALCALVALVAILVCIPAVSGRARDLARVIPAAGIALFLILISIAGLGEAADPFQTIREAARFVASRAGPDDVVASYGTILQGLTYYTNRRTTIVGGPGELAFGWELEPQGNWVVRKKELPRLFDGRKVYLVATARAESEAIANSNGQLHRVLGGPRFVVLSNE